MYMPRTLKSEERCLLKAMLEFAHRDDLVNKLDDARVSDMRDGGMRSICFEYQYPKKMSYICCEAIGRDSDEIPLEISINLDTEDRLFELDIWKVDYSPLRAYPDPSDPTFSHREVPRNAA